MTLYYQVHNKVALLLAKFAQKTFLIDVSFIPGGHFKFHPLEKNAHTFRGTWGLIFSIPPSKHTSQRVVTELGYTTVL